MICAEITSSQTVAAHTTDSWLERLWAALYLSEGWHAAWLMWRAVPRRRGMALHARTRAVVVYGRVLATYPNVHVHTYAGPV